mgnify:CR=1 FL=1
MPLVHSVSDPSLMTSDGRPASFSFSVSGAGGSTSVAQYGAGAQPTRSQSERPRSLSGDSAVTLGGVPSPLQLAMLQQRPVSTWSVEDVSLWASSQPVMRSSGAVELLSKAQIDGPALLVLTKEDLRNLLPPTVTLGVFLNLWSSVSSLQPAAASAGAGGGDDKETKAALFGKGMLSGAGEHVGAKLAGVMLGVLGSS